MQAENGQPHFPQIQNRVENNDEGNLVFGNGGQVAQFGALQALCGAAHRLCFTCRCVTYAASYRHGDAGPILFPI